MPVLHSGDGLVCESHLRAAFRDKVEPCLIIVPDACTALNGALHLHTLTHVRYAACLTNRDMEERELLLE